MPEGTLKKNFLLPEAAFHRSESSVVSEGNEARPLLWQILRAAHGDRGECQSTCRQRAACTLEVSISARLSGMLSDDLIVTLNAVTCEQATCQLFYRNCL